MTRCRPSALNATARDDVVVTPHPTAADRATLGEIPEPQPWTFGDRQATTIWAECQSLHKVLRCQMHYAIAFNIPDSQPPPAERDAIAIGAERKGLDPNRHRPSAFRRRRAAPYRRSTREDAGRSIQRKPRAVHLGRRPLFEWGPRARRVLIQSADQCGHSTSGCHAADPLKEFVPRRG